MKFFGYGVAAIIICFVVIAVNNKINFLGFSDENVLELNSGKVVLGKVYRESLMSEYQITTRGSISPAISVQSSTTNLYNDVRERYVDFLSNANEYRKAKGLDPLYIDTAMWESEFEVSYSTSVVYESEYHSSFKVLVDETLVKDDTKKVGILKHLEEVREYSHRAYEKYQKKYSFID
ncbi:hypothetical protein FM038_013405 [Shewanella eurypsychrophilus]|uniref:Uncharacterized protein n=1 Tax=Shewanella eurypsychrophilus TaxID=2593656 RepID=A0ABX6V8L8_9GAMM|nr:MULTISPECIES: hypothetical protein [Shewanella]QFU23048.1 hypothetical protein FS418_14985 [Shewanella sp. YLB-09]QPG58331.1 hypothetical protein FM038_013405 [Shewanella eurypsychrophilus]